MRKFSADHAGVGLNGKRLQTAALKNPRVGIVHPLVTHLRRRVAHVETVGVFHDEFLGAHEAEARPDFIPEFQLNLVKILRHLPVGTDLARGQQRDDFLVRRPEHPLLARAIADLVEHVGGGFVAAALLPDFRRLQRGHEDFERAGAVHFLAHDLLDLAQHAQAHRQEGVQTARELADEARAQEEFVRRDLGVGGSFFEGGNQRLGPAHKISGEKKEGARRRPLFERKLWVKGEKPP